VAIASTRWQTESYCRNSGADPPPGRRESDLGAPKIHGELQKLGFVVSERTVARYLQRVQRRCDPGKSWLTFLTNHQEVIAAFDFFTVPTLTFQVLYCFFVIEHGRRKILHFNVTRHPTAEWVVQQLREAFPEAGPYRYVILDRDAKFDGEVVAFLQGTGLTPKRTSIRSPLAKWHRGALGGKLSTGVVGPRDPAERTTLEAPCSRLCGVLSGGPHSRRPRQRHTPSAGNRKEAVCGGNSDFKPTLGWSPSSLLMARSSLGGSLRWSSPLPSAIVNRRSGGSARRTKSLPQGLQSAGSQGQGSIGSRHRQLPARNPLIRSCDVF
jgi:hypothetical protein